MTSRAPGTVDRLRFELSRLQTGRQFTAVIDYLFDIRPRRVAPVFSELVIVDGSLLFARAEGDSRAGFFVGRLDQLKRELAGFTAHAQLTDVELACIRSRLAALPHQGTGSSS